MEALQKATPIEEACIVHLLQELVHMGDGLVIHSSIVALTSRKYLQILTHANIESQSWVPFLAHIKASLSGWTRAKLNVHNIHTGHTTR